LNVLFVLAAAKVNTVELVAGFNIDVIGLDTEIAPDVNVSEPDNK
jgi:hypothetical protein